MEWNGMEWNGMEWNGMEWNGPEKIFPCGNEIKIFQINAKSVQNQFIKADFQLVKTLLFPF
jgi:hypothetical protein